MRHKKLLVALAAIAVLAMAAVGAYAYFTSTGSGAGTATVGSSSDIQLSSPLVGDLYPDGVDVPVTVTLHNPGAGTEYVGTISGVVEDQAGCLGSWFQIDDIVYNASLTRNGTAGDTDTAGTNVRMIDNGGDQDACQGLTLDITWSSN